MDWICVIKKTTDVLEAKLLEDDADFDLAREVGVSPFYLQRDFPFDEGYKKIPRFWDEISRKHFGVWRTGKAQDEVEEAVRRHGIGMFGVCIDDRGGKTFRYLIAGKFAGGKVPEGLCTYSFPALTWAKFCCTGPLPDSLQSLNTRIFREWLPENADWEIATGANLEYYSSDGSGENEIWIPVKAR